MNILVLLIVGLIAGFLADLVFKNKFGLIGDLLIGVIGSFIGGWVFGQLNLSIAEGIVGDVLTALAGAVILLIIVNTLKH